MAYMGVRLNGKQSRQMSQTCWPALSVFFFFHLAVSCLFRTSHYLVYGSNQQTHRAVRACSTAIPAQSLVNSLYGKRNCVSI